MSAPQSPIVMFPNACPCCGHATLGDRGEYDICNVCWWEDDGQDNHNANVVRGGPNGKLSLTRARINFILDGIFCPSRTDLRDKQESPDCYPRLRNFTFDLTTKSFFDHDQDWSDGHPGFRFLSEHLIGNGESLFIWQWCDPGTGEYVPNEFVLPFEQAAGIVWDSMLGRAPTTIRKWLEL